MSDQHVHATDLQPKYMPLAFRIVNLVRTPEQTCKQIRNEAVLYHDKASIRVTWVSSQSDSRLQIGRLVAIRWLGKPQSIHGAVCVSRLVLLERAVPDFNLFETVPSNWVRDRDLVQRAAELWSQLTRPLQHLMNALFWDCHRFQRFLVGPSSLNGHHNGQNGNFRHSVETAEQCMALAKTNPNVSRPVLLIAALLHDAGKADEYRLQSGQRGFVMSDRGVLVGHRHTVVEWIAVARAAERVVVPEAHYLALMHVLTSAKGAEWLGIREPLSPEAMILSAVDRLSGQTDLVTRLAPEGSGFGHYHKHLRGRPYVLEALAG